MEQPQATGKTALRSRPPAWPSGQLAEDGEYEFGIALWEKSWDEEGSVTEDFRLTEADEDFDTLQRYRGIYGV